ncbi:hypothetical protein MLD38_014283 [Melastoma candidum]|uniref:Uncharacterized protein n=1 Tax=Melastoma candidum TaxID=119954 RepID=A0ACB9RGG1_9MYRT|nr:hypothetical protein MLD38_014283 [Melastoma candidum]
MGFLSTFFTPSYLFLFVNLIIGTIYILSRLSTHHPAKPDHAVPLGRTPSSLLHRFRSTDLPFHKFESHPEPDLVHQDHTPGLDSVEVGRSPLPRTPSLLERFRSSNFYQKNFEPEPVVNTAEAAYAPTVSREPPPTLSRTSSLLNQMKSIGFYHPKSNQQTETEPAKGTNSPTLARAPSFLERVRSIKFSAFYKQGELRPDPDADDEDWDRPVDDHATHVPLERMGEQGPKLRMRKTASEKSAEDDEDAEGKGIDAKADDFIQRFRHQLRLQRLDSLKRYMDMLTGAAR